jgi:dihydrofolate synthase/folylpolyglutamate synthase
VHHNGSPPNNLPAWLAWLETCHPRNIELGLARTATVANNLSLDFGDSKVITVAGTNGKGSCVAMLAALLQSAGLTVGCYTSPHLLRFNERITINGETASDTELIAAFNTINQYRADTPLTYFEFTTLAALHIFNQAQLDVILLEVGLGGRLDAVNIVDPDIAIVTSIALDHCDWLGANRELIGREKAGIFRTGKPAICGDSNPPASIQQYAGQIAAKLYQYGDAFTIAESADSHWTWRGQAADGKPSTFADLPRPRLPLTSAACAMQAMQLLELPINTRCLASLQLPGRYQHLQYAGQTIILDVAHNPAAAAYLAQQLQAEPVTGRTYALFGVMADKDCAGMIAATKHCFDHWWVADQADNPRAMSADAIIDHLVAQGIQTVSRDKTIEQAYQQVLKGMQKYDRLVIWGSFYWVGCIVSRGS